MKRVNSKVAFCTVVLLIGARGNVAAVEKGVGCGVGSVEVAELRQLCPDPFGETSVECEQAMDRRYASCAVPQDVHAYSRDDTPWTPILRESPIVWRDLLDEAYLLRMRTDAALARPECLVPEGAIRRDLLEACDAEAMFRLSVLLDACASLRDELFQVRHPRSRWEALVDEDVLMHVAWRLRRCRTVPDHVFATLRTTPNPKYRGLRGYQAVPLRRSAARLGHIGASAGSGGLHADVNAAFADEPVLGYLRRAKLSWLKGDGMYLPYLLVAKALDADRPKPMFEWGGMRAALGGREVDAARPAADRLLSEGWAPLE